MADLYSASQSDSDLQVMTQNQQFSPIQMWLHAEPSSPAEFLQLTTADGKSLSLTQGHLIYKSSCDQIDRQAVQAGKIVAGDCLLVDTDGQLQAQPVVSVEKFTANGFYSPLTATGDILVDNILASCYSEVEAIQLQSLMFNYIGAVKSVAQAILPSGVFTRVFGSDANNVTPLSEAVEMFLGLSQKFVV